MTIERRPVTALKGVGPALAKRLGKLGIETVADLLFWLPTRYEDRTHVVPIGSLRPGMRAAVEGEIELAEVVFRGRRSLLARLSDGTGFLTLRFFHFSGAQQEQLRRGARLRCFGEVRRGKHGPEFVHPEYRDADAPDTQAVQGALTPIYPLTEGIQQGRLRNLTAQALAAADAGELADWLPAEIQRDLRLPGLVEALWAKREQSRHAPGLFDEQLALHHLPRTWGIECRERFHAHEGTELASAASLAPSSAVCAPTALKVSSNSNCSIRAARRSASSSIMRTVCLRAGIGVSFNLLCTGSVAPARATAQASRRFVRSLRAGAEQRRSDAHVRGAEANRGFEIVAHAHAERGQAIARGDLG